MKLPPVLDSSISDIVGEETRELDMIDFLSVLLKIYSEFFFSGKIYYY